MANVLWELPKADPSSTSKLIDRLGVCELIAKLLVQRGLDTPEKARVFLSPALTNLDDPKKMLGMDGAVSRLIQAIEKREKVYIYGDYDVDGVTSISVMVLFFRQVGLEVEYRIPSRLSEGYGLHESHVVEISEKGCDLLITVDCGISDVAQVQKATEIGMDVIIIDHHQLAQELPPAKAILNPFQPECTFPTKHLSAVGVCFNLLIALRAELRTRGWFLKREEPNLKEYLDLVCLGTIADVVPLTEENRIFTHFGLQQLGVSQRPGIAALKEVSGLLSSKLETGQVAFRLAPRINAVGRIGRAHDAVDLLTTESYSHALGLAKKLDQANLQRQTIEQKILTEALEQAEACQTSEKPHALVLASKDWHVGVVGIVASRLVERYDCAVVLLALSGPEGRGSARGVKGVHLYKALQECSQYLESFGGHRMAAGMRLFHSQLKAFREAFASAVKAQNDGTEKQKVIEADGELQPACLSFELIENLKSLSPYGMGNPEPRFVARKLMVKSARRIGKKPPFHIKAALEDDQNTFDAVGFGMGERLDEIKDRIDVLYTPTINYWDGVNSIQLKLRDLKKSKN